MKQKYGVMNALYPLPTTILGCHVQGRPNFITIAHVGVLTVGEPECLSFGINKIHYSNQGILANRQFSVNIPGEDLLEETDYCGLVSGKNTDKSGVFDCFYGQLEAAPLISRCPINMECEVYDVVDFEKYDIVIGRIVQTHVDEAVMSGGVVDIAKLRPLLFDMASKKYWSLGGKVGDAWGAGLRLKNLKE